MNDVIGILQSPTGHTVKVVVVPHLATDGAPISVFPTLTSNIIVAVSGDHLRDAVRRAGGDHEAPSDDDLDVAMLEFVPDIVRGAHEIIANDPPADPFGLATQPNKSTEEGA